MFVFYFGIMADLTPPVALAALAASSIAKESYMKIGFKATQIAIAGFVVPYMAVYDPALMLLGPWLDSVYVIGKTLLAIGLWGAAMIGYLWAPVSRVERLVAMVAAGLLVAVIPASGRHRIHDRSGPRFVSGDESSQSAGAGLLEPVS